MTDDLPPLSDGVETAYERLATAVGTGSVPTTETVDIIVETGYTEAGAREILDRLHNRGLVYTVESEVRITDPPTDD
ncbi:hypothetical protein BRD17_09960 [Halobacteriales archaeon SW_7_68_16]|nr:MAG: hypothetical protein BRD17_09960 [Halobacteriales archaeon SW_7_68_16]